MDDFRQLEEGYSSKGFVRKIGFGRSPALIVVDFARAFTDEKTQVGSCLTEPLKETNRVLEAARKAKIPIIFTTSSYNPSLHLKEWGMWGNKVPSDILTEGSEWVEIDPILERRPDEAILNKKYASAFFGTDLAPRLYAGGVDTIIVTGCTTSGCVRATVVDGVSHGFRVIVVREAVGDRVELSHNVSLADIDAKYGDVVSVDSVLEYLDSIGKE